MWHTVAQHSMLLSCLRVPKNTALPMDIAPAYRELSCVLHWLQVVGLERIALVVPAEAIRQFQSALGTCQEQHASGVVSTARVQPQLPPTHPPSNPGSISAIPPAPSTASAPCTPSHADHHNQISPQVKLRAPTPPPHCGVQLMEHLPPLMFQPMWILPPAGACISPLYQ